MLLTIERNQQRWSGWGGFGYEDKSCDGKLLQFFHMQSNGMQLDATVLKALTKAIQLGFCRLFSIISMSGGPIFEKKVSLATSCAD